jgi:hypothetical protein
LAVWDGIAAAARDQLYEDYERYVTTKIAIRQNESEIKKFPKCSPERLELGRGHRYLSAELERLKLIVANTGVNGGPQRVLFENYLINALRARLSTEEYEAAIAEAKDAFDRHEVFLGRLHAIRTGLVPVVVDIPADVLEEMRKADEELAAANNAFVPGRAYVCP